MEFITNNLYLLNEVSEFLGITQEELSVKHEKHLEHQISRWQNLNLKNSSELLAFYNDNLYLYELVANSRFGIVYLIEPFIHKNDRILDYGSGIGTHGLYFLKKGYDVTFADIPSPHFEFIKWYVKKYKLQAKFVNILEESTFQNKQYDAVFCFDVLEHLIEWKETLQIFFNILTKMGKLCLIVSFREFENKALHIGNISGLTEEEYLNTMSKIGFLRTFIRNCPVSLTHPKEPLEVYQEYHDTETELLSRLFEDGINFKDRLMNEEGKKCFLKLLELNPNDFGAMFQISELFFHEGKYSEAKKNLQENLNLIPNDFKAMEKLAEVEIALGNYDAAVKNLLKAMVIRPNLAYSIKKILYSLYKKGILIIPCLDRNITENWQIFLHLTSFCIEYNLFPEAKKILDFFSEKYSIKTRIGLFFRKNLAHYYRKIGDYDKSAQILNELIYQWPVELWLHSELSIVFRDAGNVEKAFSELDKEDIISPFKSTIYYNKGILYRIKKDYINSLAMLSKSITIMPEYVQVYYERGLAYREMKEYSLSMENFDKAASLIPYDATILVEKGITLKKMGRINESLKYFKKALELDARKVLTEYSGKIKLTLLLLYLIVIKPKHIFTFH